MPDRKSACVDQSTTAQIPCWRCCLCLQRGIEEGKEVLKTALKSQKIFSARSFWENRKIGQEDANHDHIYVIAEDEFPVALEAAHKIRKYLISTLRAAGGDWTRHDCFDW